MTLSLAMFYDVLPTHVTTLYGCVTNIAIEFKINIIKLSLWYLSYIPIKDYELH